MCGIAGRLNFRTGAPVDPGILHGMGDLLAHRGPDGEGFWHQEAVGLAHRRLAIIDLSDAARQPMTAEDPRVRVVLNGEIYNFRELRRELEARGHRFRTRSDTEVLLHGLRGVRRRDCLSRLARHVRVRALGRADGAGSCWRATGWARSRSSTALDADGASPSPPS